MRKIASIYGIVLMLTVSVSAVMAAENVAAEVASTSQEKNGNPQFADVSVIEEKIDALNEQIKLSETAENEATATRKGIPLITLQARTVKLRAVRATFEQLLTAIKKKEVLEKDVGIMRKKLLDQEQRGVLLDPPYNLSLYDSLLGEYNAAEQQNVTAEQAVGSTKRTLENLSTQSESLHKKWRVLKDRVESQAVDEVSPEMKWEYDMSDIEKDLLQAILLLEKAKQKNHDLEQQIAKFRVTYLQQRLNWARERLGYDEADLQRQINALDSLRGELSRRLAKVSSEKNTIEEAWSNAQEKFESAGEKDMPVAEALLKEREAWRETYQVALEQSEDMLRLLDRQKETLKLRYALIEGSVDEKMLPNWRNDAEARVQAFGRSISLQQNYLVGMRSQISAIEKRLSESDEDPRIKNHLANQLQAQRKLNEQHIDYMSALLAAAQMDQRLLEEIYLKLEEIPLKQKVLKAIGNIQNIWNYEVWSIDNRPVTISKLVVSFLILIIGLVIAKYLIYLFAKRLFRYARLKETTASAIRKVLSFLAYLLVFLFALRIVNIPLGAFAFLGGAIAIGVGFGAQNLINNFISGFIIMGERPISIGDLIEVDGILGQVEDIGARSTRVRTGENIHILVPNSSFLERNITNWTLSDKKIRTHVTVGVIYGSPVQKVEDLLLKATLDDEKVFQAPKPFVLFRDFGDNALVFEVYFWISIQQIVERRMIESSVRFRIDALFREAGLVIAFPQRDVHLDTLRPLEMRIVDSE